MREKGEFKIKKFRVYNVFFPIWLIFLFPPIIFAVLIINFMIDSLVVTISLKKMKIEHAKTIYKRTILKTWIFGFLSDIAGVLCLIPVLFINPNSPWWQDLQEAIIVNPFSHPIALLILCFAIFVAGVLIYFLNMSAFKHTELSQSQRKKISLHLAIFTAPYFFLLPMVAIYQWG